MTESFRTDFIIPKAPYSLSGQARVLTIGSCFSDVIGHKLQQYKVNTLVNPFGTIFNPVSAAQLLEAATGEDIDLENRLVERDGMWYAYDLHSSFAAATPEDLLNLIGKSMAETVEFLKQTDLLILTFGTALAYKLKETGEIVANCHKLPAAQFDREMLTPDEIVTAIFSLHGALKSINPKLKIVLTVSPVRHVKETMVLNSASKASLRVACHYLSETLPDLTYFPSYELLLDDLRDYRFYKADMLHPSEVAENYIWNKFTHTYFDNNFRNFMPEWDRISKAVSHKPFQPETPKHQQFLKDLLLKLENLNQKIDCSLEIKAVKEQLIPEITPIHKKEKNKKQKPGWAERQIEILPSTEKTPEISETEVEVILQPELAEESVLQPEAEPKQKEPITAELQPEIPVAAIPVPEKPPLTEAELEAIANRPIVAAKPWISAKEKAEARKKERIAQQQAKQTAKKQKKEKKEKTPAIVSLLAGIKNVAETKPADQEKSALPEEKVQNKAIAAEKSDLPESPVVADNQTSETSNQKPATGEKQLAITSFLQNLAGAGKPQPITAKHKKQPAKRKPKTFAKNQAKTAVNNKAENVAPEPVKPIAETKPVAPTQVIEKAVEVSAKPVQGNQKKIKPETKAKPTKTPRPAKPKAATKSDRKTKAVKPEVAPTVAENLVVERPKKAAGRKKATETKPKEKAVAKPKAKPKKEPKTE